MVKKSISEPVARKGWDNIVYGDKLAYLHCVTNTIIYRKSFSSTDWYWQNKRFNPETGKQDSFRDSDVTKLMEKVESYFCSG